jgi:hypothetical protein
VIWNGDTLSYTVEMMDSFAGFFLLEVPGTIYTEECQDFTIAVPVPGFDTLSVTTEVCLEECLTKGSWTPE